MKVAYIFRRILYAGFLIIATNCQLLAGVTPDSNTTEPLALRKIMSDLGKNMQTITDGISREDWKLVEKAASQIADHPQPPFVERIQILSFVGNNVSLFKAHDNKTHNAAIALDIAATEKDGYKVITAFSILQNTCLTCHQNFRKSFQEHFYH